MWANQLTERRREESASLWPFVFHCSPKQVKYNKYKSHQVFINCQGSSNCERFRGRDTTKYISWIMEHYYLLLKHRHEILKRFSLPHICVRSTTNCVAWAIAPRAMIDHSLNHKLNWSPLFIDDFANHLCYGHSLPHAEGPTFYLYMSDQNYRPEE